jgi:hypothetical protein
MAPEQALGQEVDARADLFALGAILYAMVAGRHAFDAPNIAAILTRVIRADPVPPSQLIPGLPAAVDAIVARGLAKSRDSRYPDGQTMAEDIADALRPLPAPLRGMDAWNLAGGRCGAPAVIGHAPRAGYRLPAGRVGGREGISAIARAIRLGRRGGP